MALWIHWIGKAATRTAGHDILDSGTMMLQLHFTVMCLTLISISGGLLMQDASAAEPGSPATTVLQRRPLIIAHRGDSSRAPENTLAAFRLGVGAKSDLVELDYFHSADGIPVVFHDKDIARTTNAGRKLAIESLTLKQLKTYDAGSWFDPRFSTEKIPTLEEALETIQAGSITLIERKGGDAATLITLLKKKKLLDQVIVQAFDWDFLTDCRRLSPEVILVALGGKALTEAKLDQIAKIGVQGVGWDHAKVGRPQVHAVHQRGWKLFVYTVNDTRRAARMLEFGVDGLITNHPLTMSRLIRRR